MLSYNTMTDNDSDQESLASEGGNGEGDGNGSRGVKRGSYNSFDVGQQVRKKLPRDNGRRERNRRGGHNATPLSIRVPQGGDRLHDSGVPLRAIAPALSVSTATTVSSMSHAGCTAGSSVHDSEKCAVREYVRQEIYPKKKTVFCGKELIYGSALASKVIEHILYDRKGFYRQKKANEFSGRREAEVGFWTRNQETVRRVLKEKVNNSISRFKEQLKSKC